MSNPRKDIQNRIERVAAKIAKLKQELEQLKQQLNDSNTKNRRVEKKA